MRDEALLDGAEEGGGFAYVESAKSASLTIIQMRLPIMNRAMKKKIRCLP